MLDEPALGEASEPSGVLGSAAAARGMDGRYDAHRSSQHRNQPDKRLRLSNADVHSRPDDHSGCHTWQQRPDDPADWAGGGGSPEVERDDSGRRRNPPPMEAMSRSVTAARAPFATVLPITASHCYLGLSTADLRRYSQAVMRCRS